MFNAGADAVDFSLPPIPSGARWHLAVDTSRQAPHDLFAAGEETLLEDPRTYHLNPRSSAILLARASRQRSNGIDGGQMKRPARSRHCFWISAASCSPTGGIIMPANGRRRTSSWSGLRWRIGTPELRHLRGGKAHAERIFGSGGLLPKATVHPRSVSALHVRAIETLSRDDRDGPHTQGKVQLEDHRGQQRSAGIECVSDSQVQAGRVRGYLYFLLLRPRSASPTWTCFGWRWTSPRRQPGRSSISKTPRCSSRSRKVWGFEAFFTRITSPHARNWLRSDCRIDEKNIHETS